MRALLTTQPGTGHLHILMPVAVALADAGHDVAICSSPALRAEVESWGFRHFDAGLDWHMSSPLHQRPWAGQATAGAGDFSSAIAHLWISLVARAMLPDLVAVAEQWRPDVIVRESTEFAGCVAAERLGIPHASVLAVVLTAEQLESPEIGAALGGLRDDADLPAEPPSEMAYRYLHLCLMAPRFFDGTEERFATAHFLRYTPLSRTNHLPEWVEQLPQQPTVFASLGTTAFARNPHLWQSVIEGLVTQPLNVVLGVGSGADPSSFGPQPPNVHVERFVPQTLLLPKCAAMVTNGGFNSLRDALSFGVPLVMIPLAGCQTTSAARCAALGLARVVTPTEATPTAVGDAVGQVLGDPQYASNARRFSQEMSQLAGPERMVGLLETLARERQPLPRSGEQAP